MRIKQILKVTLCVYLSSVVWHADASLFNKKDKKKSEQKKETAYEKLFKGKSVVTKHGMITLHKTSDKLYFEFPLNMVHKGMLLGSTVSQISDNGNALVGQKVRKPLHVEFAIRDSIVELCEVTNPARKQIITDIEDSGIVQALSRGSRRAVMEAFPVKAYNSDSTAVVIDVTEFMAGDNSRMSVFDPNGKKAMYGAALRRATFKKNLSYVDEISAFDDNITVSANLSYVQDLLYMGIVTVVYQEPVTVRVNRTLLLLPEEPQMRPRIADPRIGYFTSSKEKMSKDFDGVKYETYITKWDLCPKDEAAYSRGELSEPTKPILFYIDSAFPEEWKSAVRDGVMEWNKAFEKIGFSNVMQVRDFPKDDPEFDPANIKFNCVHYAPIGIANAMGPSWIDPRNSEIINASVFIYHDIVELINDMRFTQTAQVDERVRTTKQPADVFYESLRYIVAHEVGHCLGLMHNMAASAALPTEAYRNVEMMDKYGTTPSIMDYARFNYIAQPEDKGVKLTPPQIGVYDYYAIDWGYRYYPKAKTSQEEIPMLEALIAKHAGDKFYRYGKQQIYYGVFDPTSLMEDLSDDAVAAGEYGVKNLKYIMSNLNNWFDRQDYDYSYRANIYKSIGSQYKRYLYNAKMNIGGFYINEHYVGDPHTTSAIVPKDIQRRSLKFVIDQLRGIDWLDNPAVVRNLPFDGSMSRQILRDLAKSLITTKRLSLATYRDPNAYSPQEYLNDLYNLIWGPTDLGGELSEPERILQTEIVKALIKSSDPLTPKVESDELLFMEQDKQTIHDMMPESELPLYEIQNICKAKGNDDMLYPLSDVHLDW